MNAATARSSRRRPLLVVATGLALAVESGTPVRAEAQESRAGHGDVSLSYQYISVDGFEGSEGEIAVGEVQTHTLILDVEYHLTDRWTLAAGIPYIRERYIGPFDHDPLALDPPRTDVPNVDLGDWNGDFQDFHLGVRYLLRDGPLSVEPFVAIGIPSNNYPFFGHAAIGRNRRELSVGSRFVYTPPISDAYYQLDLTYVFMEETLGVGVDHLNVAAEAGYFFRPNLAGRLFVIYRVGDGLDFPTDFPPPRTDEKWYQHDRMVRHNFTNVGVGLGWALNDRYQLSSAVMTMVNARQIHKVEYAIGATLTRRF